MLVRGALHEEAPAGRALLMEAAIVLPVAAEILLVLLRY